MVFSAGLEHLDPALLAFVKCHVTSAARWEVLRLLADQNGEWLTDDQIARHAQVRHPDLASALTDLVDDGLVECRASLGSETAAYRLPADEPTSVVLQRLIVAATHSRELRAIIAAHLQRRRHQLAPVGPITPVTAQVVG